MLRHPARCGKEGGMRWVDFGETKIVAITDAAPAPAESGYAFPDADLTAAPQAASRWMEDRTFRTRFGAVLIRRKDGDILVDCGMGPGPVSYFPGLAGDLPASLSAAGASMQQIRTVILTHLHVDHVGWAPHFPKAKFVVSQHEWAHWSQGEAAGLTHHVAAVKTCIAPIADAGRLRTVKPETEIAPGIVLHAAPGHTPGHAVVVVDDQMLIAGDLWHNPAQIAMPSWCHRADRDKTMAVETRTRLAAAAVARGWLVTAGHFTEDVAFGRISHTQQWEPISA
eukprot:gene2076-2113_t